METGKINWFRLISTANVAACCRFLCTGGGNTKAIEVNRERSESWPQEIAQVLIAGISWPQFSM